MIQRFYSLALLATALSACAGLPERPASDDGAAKTPPIASVRHLASTEPYRGGRLYLFLFTPEAPRPLDERIRAARSAIAADPACTWINAPRDLIVSETAKQGAAYTETMLVAPLRCT